jgi:hypothetical protein
VSANHVKIVIMIHLAFELVPALAAFLVSAIVYQWRLSKAADKLASAGAGYAIALVVAQRSARMPLARPTFDSAGFLVSGDPFAARWATPSLPLNSTNGERA